MQKNTTEFEQILRENAIYSPDIKKMKKFPVDEFLSDYELEQIGKGFETRAFRIKDTNWVVKEGRWDLDFEPIMHLTVKIPREHAQRFFRAFKFTFLPEEEEVLKQYDHYLKLLEYFSYFDDGEDYYHPDLYKIKKKQIAIRSKLDKHIDAINTKNTLPNLSVLKTTLKSKLKYYNFLPKEYLLYGKSVSKQNKGKETNYIFQQFVDGKTLYEHDVKGLSGRTRRLMILFSYLVLLLDHKENLVPDLRPRYVLQTHDWFGNTDNIILTKSGPKLIDTRRLWETNSNFVKRGLLIPEMITLRTKHYLQHYLQEDL